jgi:hypothetical protein
MIYIDDLRLQDGTALLRSCTVGSFGLAQTLIARGADINAAQQNGSVSEVFGGGELYFFTHPHPGSHTFNDVCRWIWTIRYFALAPEKWRTDQ